MRKSKAFTLIELLVVISVIAVLMAILMPALGKARELAQGAACKGNLKNYTFAMAMYLADARACICPTFKTLAVRHSDDQFFMATGSQVTNYEPWYNYTMNAYLGSANSGVAKTRVLKDTDVKHPATTFSFTEESARVDTAYNASGLNDTFMIPGDDNMVEGWIS